jgi:hypothetical protein
VALASLQTKAVAFVAAMLSGMALDRTLDQAACVVRKQAA